MQKHKYVFHYTQVRSIGLSDDMQFSQTFEVTAWHFREAVSELKKNLAGQQYLNTFFAFSVQIDDDPKRYGVSTYPWVVSDRESELAITEFLLCGDEGF